MTCATNNKSVVKRGNSIIRRDMPSLKSRRECPPNGFQYTQAQTGWSQIWWDFEQAVREIANHRAGNPRFNLSTNLDDIRVELDETNALRCLSIKNAGIYVNGESPPPKPIAHQRLPAVVGVVKSGLESIEAFFESGGITVKQEVAESRARICAVCPLNNRGDWTSLFTVPAAALIRKRIEKKNEMKLLTSKDSELGVCGACLCPLKLKTWFPINIIREHMDDEVKSNLHESCWITRE